ncbi:hypothetical protein AB0K60_08830 [Thermopolyspora sp. NPDC052614]|uniref:hypothetical protein n=1 Tax=Thermopolyspora sp. NPDC052614 TaxID=3155682 RepID=UPI00344456AD
MEVSDPVRRLCVAVAADGPDRGRDRPAHPPAHRPTYRSAYRSARQQVSQVVRQVARAVEDASMAAGLDQATLQILPAGVLVVLNSGVNEARVVTDLTRELRNALWRRNQRHADSRLRCRISYHQGLVRLTDEGFEGQAVTVAGDLCASAALRAALAEDPRHDLAMIISGRLLDDLAYPESDGLHRHHFRPVTVPTGGRSILAYIYSHDQPT